MGAVTVKVRRWGNSLAAIIPAEVAEREGIREGDELVITLDRTAIRNAFGSMKHGIDPQKMKDEDRDAW